MRRSISTSDDILDSRDIEKRIDELESDRDCHEIDCKDCDGTGIADLNADERGECDTCEGSGVVSGTDDSAAAWATDNENDAAELKMWTEARDECGSREWPHGLTLIRDSYFETYAQELAEDIGALEKCDHWPTTCIDWERAARELQQDYSMVVIDGEDYHYRD